MKKIILAACVILINGGVLFAQQSPSAKPAQEKTKPANTESTPAAKKKTHHKHTADVKPSASTPAEAKKQGKATKE